MAYERSPIAETPSAIPNQPAAEMRETREFTPFKGQRDKVVSTTNAPTTGQSTISKGALTNAATEEPVAQDESVKLSPQLAAIARKEQKFRQSEQALKARETELQAKLKRLEELEAFNARIEAKDFSAIEEKVKYDEYTNYLIEKDAKLSPEAEELKKLQAKVGDVEKALQDDVSKRFEAAVNERRKAVKSLVDSSSTFAAIKKAEATEHVVQHILDTWEQDGIDLSVEEAAKEVEEALREKAKKWSSLIAEDENLSSGGEVTGKKELPPLKAQIKTLTNNMAATGEIKRPVKSLAGMTDSERWAEARRRAEEKLSKGIR